MVIRRSCFDRNTLFKKDVYEGAKHNVNGYYRYRFYTGSMFVRDSVGLHSHEAYFNASLLYAVHSSHAIFKTSVVKSAGKTVIIIIIMFVMDPMVGPTVYLNHTCTLIVLQRTVPRSQRILESMNRSLPSSGCHHLS